MAMKKTISQKYLKKILSKNNLKIIDSRWFLNDPLKGLKEFEKSHIPNAIFFDIEKISDKKKITTHVAKKIML